jgi:DNA helicase II / ATP-dependent DNA helicase PcrA
MVTDLLEGLNPQQREAVTAGDGPVLVLAGPGSGKTRVLTHRIAYLVRECGVQPHNIMAVTFTNKAANEMRVRVENILGGRLDGLQIGTFHSICSRMLRREADSTVYGADYAIYDTDDQQTVVKQVLGELNVDPKKFNPGRVLNAISACKNELITPEMFTSRDYFGEVVGRVYRRYQAILVANNAMDFDDLLMQTVVLFQDNEAVRFKWQRRLEHILVDEFQDTNTAQYKLVQIVSLPQNNVFVVGDEDQGIYAFRGADYRNVLQFRTDYPDARVILLEQNYRSTQIVLDAARAIIDKNAHRTPKALFTERTVGPLVNIYEAYSEAEEGEFIAKKIAELRRRQNYDYNDIAVMYRTNAQSRALEEACVSLGVPYKLVGGVGFYKRREIRDLLAYMRLVNNPDDTVSFGRVINVPGRGIGKKSQETFIEWIEQRGLTIWGGLQSIMRGEASPVTGKAAKSFAEFGRMIADWRALLEDNNLLALFDEVTTRTGYNLYVHEISETPEQVAERLDNITELRALVTEKRDLSLNDFLAETALVADVDTLKDDMNAVTLLTLHAAKGLEYPVVFIAGMEEGLLPHFRTFDDPDGMAEERRLLYVGLTRAKDQVYLTYAFRRMLYGDSTPGIPSRFLADIPSGLTEGASTTVSSLRDRSAYQRMTTWEQNGSGSRTPSRTPNSPSGDGRSKIIPFNRQPAPEAPPLKYRTGVRVAHAKFGEGVVIESIRYGQDEEVTVAFEKSGIKKLAASFANLIILKG